MLTVEQSETANLVRELRQQLHLSQEKFAGKLGVSVRTVNRWENGQASPSPLAIEKLEAISQALNITAKVTQQGATFLERERSLANRRRAVMLVEQSSPLG